jgi:hypothetical protein
VNSIGPTAKLHQDFASEAVGADEPGMHINLVNGSQPKVPITIDPGATESEPGPYPFPPNAKIESGSDRHVLVLDTTNCLLYETFDSFKNPDNSWNVYSGAIFDLRKNLLRPQGWTSSDAAGLPIMPGLARYEEILEGEIKHALRFTAPRTNRDYIWPARHFASSVNDASLPSMGARFRLKANFDISSFSPTTKIILTALKRYGMMLADNGSSWYIQGTFDSRWPNMADEWRLIPGSAFEAVDTSSLKDNEDSAAVRGVAATPMLEAAAFVAATVSAGQGATLRVSLTGSAPAGGLLVALGSGNPGVATIASSVLIPEASSSVLVPVTTSALALQSQVVFTASLAGLWRQAALTVNAAAVAQPPSLQSLTPSSGSGDRTGFAIRTSEVARVDILVGPALDWATGCHVSYNITLGAVYLRNDSGAWPQGTPGGPGTLSNARCSVDVAQVSTLLSGTAATTTIPFRFTSAFTGTQQVFVRAWDRAGLDTSWRTLGSWTVVAPPEAPAIRSMTPSSGTGELANFVAAVSDNNGASTIARVDVLIGPGLDTRGCHFSYNVPGRLLYLRNLDLSWQAVTPGNAGILDNSRCRLDAAKAGSSIAGTTLSNSLPVRFSSSFTGTQTIYVRAWDAGGLDSNWVIAGTWTASVAQGPPQFRAFAPASGSGELASFVTVVSNPSGASNLGRVEILTGPALENTGCHAIYNAQLNLLYLRNADGSWLSGTPGAAATLLMTRCSVDLRNVTRLVAGTDLTLAVPMRFAASFAGNFTVFVRAVSQTGLDTSWRIGGSWSR